MKTLFLLRHAKSSWANPELPDHDRALNKRGQRACRLMGDWLGARADAPQVALVSDARRALQTFERLELAVPMEVHAPLYLAAPADILRVLSTAEAQRVMVVGHNPGMAELAAKLVQTAPKHERFDQFPTTALLVLSFDVDRWDQIEPGQGKLLAFVTPHDLMED